MPAKVKAKASEKSEKAVKKVTEAKPPKSKENSQKQDDDNEKPSRKETPTTDEKMTDEEATKDKQQNQDNEETKEPAADESSPTPDKKTSESAETGDKQARLGKRRPKQISQLKDLVLKFLGENKPISDEVKLYKKDALVFEIYETFPLFLVHDGHFFVNCVFSKEAWASLKKQVKENEKQLSDMTLYRLAIENYKLQTRKVKHSQQVFTSYGTLEVRLIITKAEITERRVGSNLPQQNPEDQRHGSNYVRSLFRDEEVRTMILARFHHEVIAYAKTVELPTKLFSGEKVIYQGEIPKVDQQVQYVQVLDCLPDTLADSKEIVDASQIIIEEKGQEHFDQIVEKRRQADEKRRQKEEEMARQKEAPLLIIKQQQFNRQQNKHKHRRDRSNLKDFADSINAIQVELKRLRSNKLRSIDKKPEDEILKVKMEDPAQKVGFKRFQRYIQWFQDRMIIKEEQGIDKSASQEALQAKEEAKIEACYPETFFKDSDCFTIALIKRDSDLIKERQKQFYSATPAKVKSKQESVAPANTANNAPPSEAQKHEDVIPVKSTISPKQNAMKFGINKSATPKSLDKFAKKPAVSKPAEPSQKSEGKSDEKELEEESKVKVINDDDDDDDKVQVKNPKTSEKPSEVTKPVKKQDSDKDAEKSSKEEESKQKDNQQEEDKKEGEDKKEEESKKAVIKGAVLGKRKPMAGLGGLGGALKRKKI